MIYRIVSGMLFVFAAFSYADGFSALSRAESIMHQNYGQVSLLHGTLLMLGGLGSIGVGAIVSALRGEPGSSVVLPKMQLIATPTPETAKLAQPLVTPSPEPESRSCARCGQVNAANAKACVSCFAEFVTD